VALLITAKYPSIYFKVFKSPKTNFFKEFSFLNSEKLLLGYLCIAGARKFLGIEIIARYLSASLGAFPTATSPSMGFVTPLYVGGR